MGSLLVHVLSLLTLLFFSFFLLLTLLLFSLFSLFSISLFFLLCFLSFLLVVHCAQLRPFYTACCDKIYTPQLFLVCCGCLSLTTHWSASCPATTTTLCWLRQIPFPDKGSFVLFSCFSWHFHLDRIEYYLLLTPMACT